MLQPQRNDKIEKVDKFNLIKILYKVYMYQNITWYSIDMYNSCVFMYQFKSF